MAQATQVQAQDRMSYNSRMQRLVLEATQALQTEVGRRINRSVQRGEGGGNYVLKFGAPKVEGVDCKAPSGKTFQFNNDVRAERDTYTYSHDGVLVGSRMPQIWFAGYDARSGNYVQPCTPDQYRKDGSNGECGVPWSRLLFEKDPLNREQMADGYRFDFSATTMLRTILTSSGALYHGELPPVVKVWGFKAGIICMRVVWGDRLRAEPPEESAQAWDEKETTAQKSPVKRKPKRKPPVASTGDVWEDLEEITVEGKV